MLVFAGWEIFYTFVGGGGVGQLRVGFPVVATFEGDGPPPRRLTATPRLFGARLQCSQPLVEGVALLFGGPPWGAPGS